MEENISHLAAKQCVLLLVDIQERLMPVIAGRDMVLKNSILLIKAAKIMGVPIVATTQYAARIGALLPAITAELGDIRPIDKMEFDCFNNGSFCSAVKKLPWEVNTLIICGVETHICIYQTVIGGLQRGYRIWAPADGVSSRTVDNHATGLDRMKQAGALVGNTELIIYELLQRAGTSEFKELLPFLK